MTDINVDAVMEVLDQQLLSKFQNCVDQTFGYNRFIIVAVLGEGTYGIVAQAIELPGRSVVAIKFTKPEILQDSNNSLRVLREIELLKHFKSYNYLVSVHAIAFNPELEFPLFFTMDYVETSLDSLIRSGVVLTEPQIRLFMYQLTCALSYLHKAGVIHRDVTPSNILIDYQNNYLQLADFGLAAVVQPPSSTVALTDYVCMRYYRAPELVMEEEHYNASVDMWSMGCVYVFCHWRAHLFPGPSPVVQLNTILHVIGTPPEQEISSVGSECAQKYIRQHCGNFPTSNLEAYINEWANPPISKPAVDLLEKLLVFSPNRRLTADQALEHEYFADVKNPVQDFVPVALFLSDTRDIPRDWNDLSQRLSQPAKNVPPMLSSPVDSVGSSQALSPTYETEVDPEVDREVNNPEAKRRKCA